MVKDKEGNEVEQEIKAKQHLFLDVPKNAVGSPWVGEPTEYTEALNNDLDYNWESLAWLRVPGREGAEKDIVLVRHVTRPIAPVHGLYRARN